MLLHQATWSESLKRVRTKRGEGEGGIFLFSLVVQRPHHHGRLKSYSGQIVSCPKLIDMEHGQFVFWDESEVYGRCTLVA